MQESTKRQCSGRNICLLPPFCKVQRRTPNKPIVVIANVATQTSRPSITILPLQRPSYCSVDTRCPPFLQTHASIKPTTLPEIDYVNLHAPPPFVIQDQTYPCLIQCYLRTVSATASTCSAPAPTSQHLADAAATLKVAATVSQQGIPPRSNRRRPPYDPCSPTSGRYQRGRLREVHSLSVPHHLGHDICDGVLFPVLV